MGPVLKAADPPAARIISWWLKDDPATREIPVLVVSADATRDQEERLLAIGARAYLIKPLDVRSFLHVVDAVLQQAA